MYSSTKGPLPRGGVASPPKASAKLRSSTSKPLRRSHFPTLRNRKGHPGSAPRCAPPLQLRLGSWGWSAAALAPASGENSVFASTGSCTTTTLRAGTPPAIATSLMKREGTQTSSTERIRASQPCGKRSDSNIVRPTVKAALFIGQGTVPVV